MILQIAKTSYYLKNVNFEETFYGFNKHWKCLGMGRRYQK